MNLRKAESHCAGHCAEVIHAEPEPAKPHAAASRELLQNIADAAFASCSALPSAVGARSRRRRVLIGIVAQFCFVTQFQKPTVVCAPRHLLSVTRPCSATQMGHVSHSDTSRSPCLRHALASFKISRAPPPVPSTWQQFKRQRLCRSSGRSSSPDTIITSVSRNAPLRLFGCVNSTCVFV